MTDPRVPLLDEALKTLETYRARSPRTSSATATWRRSDAARIIAALPAVGLVLVTKEALDGAEAVVAAARKVLAQVDLDTTHPTTATPSPEAVLRNALVAYDTP
jgi:hypothetical protein